MLVTYEMILLYSLSVWSFAEVVTYSLTRTRFYSLVGTNYDVFILLSFRPLLFIVVVLCLFFVSNSLRYHYYGKQGDEGFMIFSLIIVLVSLVSSIIMANYPYVVHRDVYLHGGVSEFMIINGKFDQLATSRADAYISPLTFILYSIHSMVININVVSLQILMTVLYPVFLVIFLYSLTNNTRISISKIGSLPVLIASFPTLITHTVGITLLHRYYLSLLVIFNILTITRKGLAFRINDIIILSILFISLQFIHPMTAAFIVIFAVIRFLALVINRDARPMDVARWRLITLTSLIAFTLHTVYLYPAHMVQEAFEWLIDIEKFVRFIEVSQPVRIKIGQEYEEQALLYFAQTVRWLWRVTLILMAAIFLRAFLLNLRNISSLLSTQWISLLASTVIISLPLIHSFLWQIRFLPYFGVATIVLLREEFEKIHRDRLLKVLCTAVTILSVVIPPVIHYERSYLGEMWNPPSLIHTLKVFGSLSDATVAYGGIYTCIYYTFYRDAYGAPRMISVYDFVTRVFRPDVFSSAIGKPIVLSVLDPEYQDFTIRLALWRSEIVYNSATTSVHIVRLNRGEAL